MAYFDRGVADDFKSGFLEQVLKRSGNFVGRCESELRFTEEQLTAMRSLTATEKTAFVLRHMEGRNTTEIAEVLHIAPNAAKQAVFRAVQKLRRSLAPLRVTP